MSAFHGGERTLIGRTLGHYAVVSAIGAGGMGEVYRAHDTRLGRDVALKVLPARMAADPERLERFRREAWAVDCARALGAMAPEVDRRICDALREAGVE